MEFIIHNLFYLGTFLIVGIFVWLFILRFKDEDEIDLKEHKWIIILYTFLMVLAIVTWRVVYLLIMVNFEKVLTFNKITESLVNG